MVPAGNFLPNVLDVLDTKIARRKCRKECLETRVPQYAYNLRHHFFARATVNNYQQIAYAYFLVRFVVYAGFDNFMALGDLPKHRVGHLRIMCHLILV